MPATPRNVRHNPKAACRMLRDVTTKIELPAVNNATAQKTMLAIIENLNPKQLQRPADFQSLSARLLLVANTRRWLLYRHVCVWQGRVRNSGHFGHSRSTNPTAILRIWAQTPLPERLSIQGQNARSLHNQGAAWLQTCTTPIGPVIRDRAPGQRR